MLLHGESLDSEKEAGGFWLLANISALHVDCTAAGASRALILSASIIDASAKLMPRKKHPCFGELSCGITLEASVKAYGPLSIEKVHCTVSNPTTTINESLYGFIANRKQSKTSTKEPKTKRIYQSKFTDDFFARLSPIIPKNFSLKIDMTTVTGVKSTNSTEFLASLQNVQINTRFCAPLYNTVPTKLESVVDPKLKLPQVYVAFQIEQLQVHSHKEKLLLLNKLKLDAKLEKSVLNLYLIMNVISLTYNHEDVYAWYHTHIQSKKSMVMQVTTAPKKKVLPPWLESLFSACVVQGCAELWGVSLHARTNQTSGISLGCGGLKIKLDQLADSRGSKYTSNLGRLLLGSRHWSTELLVDSGWLTAGPGASSALEPPQKKQHVWGTTFYLGVALIKWGSHGPNDSKIEAMLDCLRMEWNTSVAKAVSCVIDCVQEYVGNKPCSKPVQKMNTSNSASSGGILTVNVALTNVNVFTIMDESTCLMMRLDAVTTDKSEDKVTFVVSGLKTVELIPYRSGCICQRSDEISSSFFHIKLARIEHMPAYEKTPSFLDIQVLEYMNLEWSANLHLKLLTIFKDIDSFKIDLKQRTCRENVEAVPREVKSSNVKSSSWCVSFKGDISMAFTLSIQNQLRLNSDDLTITKDLITGISVAWNRVRAILNGDDIITVDGFTMERVADDPLILEERAANENFKLEWNNVWGVNIGSMMLVFPYEHRFAEAIQGEFVSHFKWLKAIHEYKKKPFTADSPLPSDLQIKIEEFILEMSDDPFEVKLRDNYELLEDEYKESLKRKSMLDAKVAELCKPHLFLPVGKVEQLYTALRHKDAQIYVQRSRAAPPPRTRLVACVFTNVELLAMADPSVHGTQNCIRVMKDIDFDSPWPEDGLEFSTLWCRAVVAKFSEWQLLLRDFPQPLLSMKGLKLWGDIVGAEQTAPPRALRTVTIEQGQPWGAYEVERSMMTLKFYHDLNCEMEYYSYSFGPCWEPVIAQCNISFEQVSRPSLDPSLPLAWWDKMRLLFHGRLTVLVSRFSCLLHASLDPYNTTEEMELTWSDVVLDWTNGKVVFRGELNVFVRTASKYDDCRLLHLPGLKLAMKFGWICVADPRDHHSVSPCAPDKLPEYSSNQEHDSFRAFRSQGLNLHLTLDTKPSSNNYLEGPQLLVYGSTLRWFESLKLILSGVTRPTRRGAVFRNIKPRRPQLSRHYRLVRLSLALHSFQVYYWSSSSMQRGIELVGGRVTCGCEHSLSLVPCNDVAPLKRRPRANWTAVYMNCELSDAVMWLKSALQEHETTSEGGESGARSLRDSRSTSLNVPVEKCYCLSVGLVSYGREASGVPCGPGGQGGVATPTHRLTVHDLRGAWTKTNRDVAFVLFDTYMKTKQLKKNLSTKALKEEDKVDASPKLQREEVVSPPPASGLQGVSPGGPPHAAQAMLAQLVAEAEREPPIVFSDDMSGGEASSAAAAGGAEARAGPALHGPKYCVDDENAHNNWLIALVNSQVLLKGYETRGYVILSAARAEVRQRVHRAPAAATSWCGELTCMQYYATVSAGEADELEENIQWVSVDEIEERSSTAPEISTFPDVPNLVGSGHSAGGVIGSTVGPSADRTLTQLQRIVSRCACEFYYLSYEDEGGAAAGGTGGAGGSVCWDQPPPEPCDAFTLMHHDLDVCTNSLQYAMLLDVVNNLVLYVEPERRRTLERRVRMRFKMQLQDVKDPRKPIQLLQNQVRGLVAKLRRLEKECYLVRRAREGGEHDSQNSIDQEKNLQAQVNECKEQVWTLGEELDAMVRVWREKKAPTAARAEVMSGAHAPPLRLNEICFKSARWRLTDADGQLGIADLVLTNFLYTKTSRTDDSVEHQLELGYMRVLNLLPREPFPEVLVPASPSAGAPLARRAALRVFCRDRPPVGGISVKEHFEVNLVPITIGLTKKFFNTMLKFCFPERDPEAIDGLEADDDDTASLKSGVSAAPSNTSKKSSKKKSKDSSFYVKMDDVEKMKERAEKNKLFIYIKIPEVPVRVSYKGSKEKNLEDFRDMPLVVPTLEYHNVTWTWLDLLLAMKSDTRRVIVSQAIRQRLQISRRAAAAPAPQEEDKARLLLGDIMVADTKPQKKNVFKFSK